VAVGRLLGVALALVIAFRAGPVSSAGAADTALEVCGQCTVRTITDALARARSGAVIRVEAGTYPGPLIIDKPVRLEGVGWPIIDGQGRGTVVRVTAPGAAIRGFVIRHSGASYDREDSGLVVEAANVSVVGNQLVDDLFGIYLKNAPGSRIEGNLIVGRALPEALRGDGIKVWYSADVQVIGNTVRGARDCLLWFSDRALLRDNLIVSGRYGLHFMYGNGSRVVHNRLQGNSVGIYLMYGRDVTVQDNLLAANRGPSGYGLGIKEVDGAAVTGNVIRDNRVGIFVDTSPLSPDVHNVYRGNVLAANDVGLLLTATDRNSVFTRNSLIDNLVQVAVEGGALTGRLQWSEGGIGNYWSDYVGYVGSDGRTGAVPYEGRSLADQLMQRYPPLQFFRASAAAEALDLAARAFPLFQPDPVVVDPAPLIRPVPAVRAPREPAGSPWPLRALGLALLGLAGGVLGWGLGGGRPGRTRTACEGGEEGRGRMGGLSEPLVQVAGLGKAYDGREVVRDLSFSVRAGEALALWGPNGAGKTTVLRCLLGRTRYRGTISIAGLSPARDGRQVRALIGFVPQEPLGFDLTVADLTRLIAGLRGVPVDRARENLNRFNLADLGERSIATLSGGMRQRLAIALALIGRPPLLLLDEPTANLDAASRRELLGFLGDLKREGLTIIFTSHRWSDVVALADRVLRLEGGRLRTAAGPADGVDGGGAGITLRVRLGADGPTEAAALLTGHGFAARCDGAAVAVAVPPNRKAEPLALLARTGLPVIDFEIEEEP
jgi:nitrous oxidase accessory protein